MNPIRIFQLIKREFIIESRKKSTVAGIFLFTAMTVFLVYKTFNSIKPFEWNVMFWILILFSGVNAIAKSFIQDGNSSRIHDYTLFNPIELIFAKLIYNFIFMASIYLVIFLGFAFFLNNPVKDYHMFLGSSALGMFGISTIYTFISAISGHSDGSSLLMSILALPLTLPIILLLLRTSAASMRILQDTSIGNDILLLGGIDLMCLGVVLLLFKVVWRD